MTRFFKIYINVYSSLFILFVICALLNKKFNFVNFFGSIEQIPFFREINDFKDLMKLINWNFSFDLSSNPFQIMLDAINYILQLLVNVVQIVFSILKIIIVSPIESIVYIFTMLFG